MVSWGIGVVLHKHAHYSLHLDDQDECKSSRFRIQQILIITKIQHCQIVLSRMGVITLTAQVLKNKDKWQAL
jgi:hypothetical protein